MEILHGQTGDSPKQLRFQLCDHILQRVLAVVRQVHERRNARRKLDQLLLHELALGLVFLLLLGELLLLLRGQLAVLALVLQLLDLLALVDDRLDDAVSQRAPSLDAFDRGHRLGIVEDAAQRVVVHIHEQRGLPIVYRTSHSVFRRRGWK